MKPKYRKIACMLPTAVTLVFSLPSISQAAGIFVDDTAGNALPTAADNGATTIVADGGTASNPLIQILAGTSLTGEGTKANVVEISDVGSTVTNYTMTNAGSLSGTNHNGIFATQTFSLNNTGTIAGGTSAGKRGILTIGGITSITNSGSITGTDDGIHFTSDGGTVNNSGTISGTTGSVSDGIRGRSNLVVSNLSGGSITGVQYGIYADANVNVSNAVNASISATNEDAIHLTADGGQILNNGSITAAGGSSSDGIRGRNGLTVENRTNFDIFSNAVSGGTISGSQYGIFAGNGLTVTNEELATISGGSGGINAGNDADITNDGTISASNGDGIHALDDASVINYSGATINGTNGTGVWLDDFAEVTNNGTITGTDSGVRVSDNSTVTNNFGALISGDLGIDAFAGTGATFILNNSGTITGSDGEAINGVLGADTLNLNPNSVINGDINLESGNDNVTMTSNLMFGNIVNGDIDGGIGTDTLTFNGGKIFPGGNTNIVNGDVTFMQDIIKNGSGTAFIGDVGSSREVETDAINVNSGGLYINGDVYGATISETIITNDGGELGGVGLWDAAITQTDGAALSAGGTGLAIASDVEDSIGTLTITGDVTMDSTSSLTWNAAPGGPSDQLILTGAGNVFTANGSNFVIAPTDVNAPLLNGNTTVVSTESLLVGSFDDISVLFAPDNAYDNGPFYANQNDPIIASHFATLTQVDGFTDWQLTIEHDYSQFGANANQVAAGEMLNDLVDTATGNVADLLAAMDYSDESVTQSVLAALDPGAYMATAAALMNSNYHLHRTVENHNAAMRAGSPGCQGTSNVWGNLSYDWQDLNTSSSAFDQDGDIFFFTGGIDFTVSTDFRLGFVAEGSQADYSGSGQLGSDIDSYRFAAYANWGAATGWYVDALLGYNTHSVDQSSSSYLSRGASQSASFDADGWQGLLNVGYAMKTTAGLVSPFLGLEWQQVSTDSFQTRNNPIALGINGYDLDSMRILAGVRYEGEITTSVKGYATLAYAFEIEDDAATTKVSFGGGSYTAQGLEQGDSLLLSAGIRWNVSTCTDIDFGYRGEFAMDDGIDSNGVNVGVNYSF